MVSLLGGARAGDVVYCGNRQYSDSLDTGVPIPVRNVYSCISSQEAVSAIEDLYQRQPDREMSGFIESNPYIMELFVWKDGTGVVGQYTITRDHVEFVFSQAADRGLCEGGGMVSGVLKSRDAVATLLSHVLEAFNDNCPSPSERLAKRDRIAIVIDPEIRKQFEAHVQNARSDAVARSEKTDYEDLVPYWYKSPVGPFDKGEKAPGLEMQEAASTQRRTGQPVNRAIGD